MLSRNSDTISIKRILSRSSGIEEEEVIHYSLQDLLPLFELKNISKIITMLHILARLQ